MESFFLIRLIWRNWKDCCNDKIIIQANKDYSILYEDQEIKNAQDSTII